MSNFDRYYVNTLKERYADFQGRARRSEFWYFYLFYVLIIIGSSFSLSMLKESLALTVTMILVFAHVLPLFSVVVRRLHDTNRSGWWFFISLIPVIGTLLLIAFLVQDSVEGENEWGPNPKYDDDIYEL